MRTTALAPILLLLPVAVWGQAQTTSATGHFEGWPSAVRLSADQRAFDVRLGIRGVEAIFTVAENGLGWRRAFTNLKDTVVSWEDVTAWCWAPATLAFRVQQRPSPSFGVYDLKPEDLVAIVDGYFKKYAPEAEWSAPGWECTPPGLSRPRPADMSKVRELLEAASAEEP